ncbi:MAG TPA: GAF domain-containing sensor histidine kinase [Chloroflexota bacterium]
MQSAAAISEAQRLRLVLALGQRVTSLLDLEVLLPEACRLIAEAFGFDLVGINLVDPLDARRLFQAAAFPPERRLPRSFRVALGHGLTGWVARHGRPCLVNDVENDPRYVLGPGREQVRAELDLPLKLGRRTLGVLNIESEQRDAFAASDVPYLRGLAGQLAQAIDNARLAADSRQLAAAEERARLARDLHDETIQELVALGRQLDLLGLDLPHEDAAAARLERIQTLLAATLDGVRRLSQNQRPAALEDLGLEAALRAHADAWGELGLRVTLEITGEPRRSSRAIEYAVYRVAQEALSNAARHAGVSEVDVELRFSPDELCLTVTDAGHGFSTRRTAAGQGLLGMRDRAAEIGAELEITSPASTGHGTRVRLWVPLKLTLLNGR